MQTRFAALDPGEFALPRAIAQETLSPALVIDLARVRENVRRVLRATGGPRAGAPT